LIKIKKTTSSIKKLLLKVACIAGVIACIADFVILFILGTYYPGYNQFRDSMSALGASISPVSNFISAWWIILGFLFFFFGWAFSEIYQLNGAPAKTAALLLMLYGLGEGIGSGIFKANHLGKNLTFSGYIHEILGGIGVVSILILPLYMKKIIPKKENPSFHKLANAVFTIGLLTLIFFSFRFSNNPNHFINKYKGLWQRLMMLNNYVFLLAIANKMWLKQRSN